MDMLDRLIQLAQIKGRFDVHCRFGGGWYVRHDTRCAQGLVHIVTGGTGWLLIDGESSPRLLQKGDVVFLPRTAAHTLSSQADGLNTHQTPQILQNGAFTLKHSGDGNSLQLFCARFDYQPHSDLMIGLPDIIMMNMQLQFLHHIISLLEAESNQILSGSAAVVDALSTVLLVCLLRHYLEQNQTLTLNGLLQGWQDRRLRPLIQEMLNKPQAEWAVGDMAATAKLSRAQLMRVFKQQTGFSPHAFITRIRLQQAAALLNESADSVLSIALACGFQSETHFGKAFKKQFGITPGQYRRQGFYTGKQPEAEYFI